MDCLTSPNTPDSAFLETLSGRGTLFEIMQRAEAIRRMDALLSECKWNISVLDYIYETIEKNRKNPEKGTFVTERFMALAVELLLATRYLDEDSSFYLAMQRCFASILALNDQLAIWESKPQLTEAWFLKHKDTHYEHLRKPQNAIADA